VELTDYEAIERYSSPNKLYRYMQAYGSSENITTTHQRMMELSIILSYRGVMR